MKSETVRSLKLFSYPYEPNTGGNGYRFHQLRSRARVFRPPVSIGSNHLGAAEMSETIQPSTLKVMTINVAHGRKNGFHQILQKRSSIQVNLNDIVRVFMREQPHVIALQEADAPSRWSGHFDHVAYLARMSDYPFSVLAQHVQKRVVSYGTALLSKLDLTNPLAITFPPSPPTPSKGATICTVPWPGVPGTNVHVASVHLDFSRKSVRHRQVSEIIDNLSWRQGPLIVMGDFNCEWSSWNSPLRRLSEILNLRPYRPDAAGLHTFPDLFMRLDWILISRELEFFSHAVVDDVISDHFAVVSEIVLTQPSSPY